MSKPYLEITYREGKPFAAYLYLDRRPEEHVARTERHDGWLIDFAVDGRALGVEFLQVTRIDLAALNQALNAARQPTLSTTDLLPLEAA